MGRFRRILAIPMLLTALGLLWILSRQAGVEGMALGLGSALVLAVGLFLAGRGRSPWLGLAPAAAVSAAALFVVTTTTGSPALARSASSLPSEPFSEQRLEQLRAEGRPVFVYFTADWCLTCKVNERGVMQRGDVAQSFSGKNIAVLAGDWTRGDAAIGRFLEKQGRSGVPLYLYYAPGRPPETLPQILTASRLTALGG
jgi:thiol:disulfide interchange protein